MARPLEHAFKRSLGALLRLLFRSRRNPEFDPGAAPRILVVRQHNQLGDMLCVVPLLRALRSRYPSGYIALMASPVNYDVMEGHRFLDEVINYDKRRFIGKGEGSLLRFPAYARALKKKRFDVAVVPSTVSTSFTSDLFAYLSGARIRIGAGSIEGKENPSAFFFTHPRILDWEGRPDRHQVLRNLDIWPEPLPEEDLSIEMTLKDFELNDGKSFIQKTLAGSKKVIIYHPGAGKVPNRWPAGSFSRLANVLARSEEAATVLTSGPMDGEVVSSVAAGLEGKYEIIEKSSIRRVASILRFADLVISNDTGVMHVAAAAGAPVLSLFGPTDPAQWAPIGPRHRYIRGAGGDITRIRIEDVLVAARQMLRSGME